MSGLLANYRNECAKLMSSKKYIVFIIIEILICAVAVFSKLIVTSISKGTWTMNNISSPISLMTLFVQAIVPFIIMLASCDLFAGEFQDKTIRAVFMRPTARYKVFVGKVLAVITIAAVNMAVVLISSSIFDIIVSGSVVNLGYAVWAYILDMVPLAVLALMTIMINQLVKNSTFAMFLAIIVYIGLNVLGIYFSNLSGLVFTGYMQWHKPWLGAGLPISALFSKILLMLGYGLTFTAVGYYLFRFKEC